MEKKYSKTLDEKIAEIKEKMKKLRPESFARRQLFFVLKRLEKKKNDGK